MGCGADGVCGAGHDAFHGIYTFFHGGIDYAECFCRQQKEPIGGGRSRYAVSGKADHIDNTKRLKLILNECSVGVDYAGIVVLLKTLPGLADAAGAAIDAMKLPDMLGCISGNDAVAIVARGEQEAERLCYDLRQYCK